jgi:streptogrisin C
VAFAARSAQGVPHLITGPGCEAPGVTLFSGNNVLVGVVRANRFPSGYSVVTVTNTGGWTVVPWINTPTGRVVIQGSRETPVGGVVCRLGRTTGWRCGAITAKNVTVSFPQGTITGLTRTNVCAEPGDAGAAFVSGNQAQGVLIGASGNCTTGGVSFFVPVNKILASFGLVILTG